MTGASGPSGADAQELLQQAAVGKIGVDRKFVRTLLDSGDLEGVLDFAHEPREGHRLDLDPLLIDLFRYQPNPAALDFLIGAVRRAPDDVDENLVEALLPFAAQAVEPLMALYDELGEERGSDVAFLLAGLRVRDPRVLELLLERLEYDASDGAFCLGLYGDPAAKPKLQELLAELQESDEELRHEIEGAIEQLDAPEPQYQSEPFDIFAEYPEHQLPAFDVLEEAERIELLESPEADVRAGAAHSFFNQELRPAAREALFDLAQTDPEPVVRGQAWASLADATGDDPRARSTIFDALLAVLNDESKAVEERGGAAVGLYGVADREDVRKGLEALYALGGKARTKALEVMWRSLWEPYAKFFPENLDSTDPETLRQTLRGAGYFRLTSYSDKIADFFDREDPYDDLREDALFAYALAMPGETTRGRVRGMLRKIDGIAHLTQAETELVMFALDERLRLNQLAPVFEEDAKEPDEEEAEPAPAAAKVGRNDPCPCGSGKKYKKCHGA